MVGVLCNSKNENALTKDLNTLLGPLIKEKEAQLIVFSLPNVNLPKNTVFGSIISDGRISLGEAALPLTIFNLSVQHAKSNIKKMRSLMEIEDISVINSVNHYNQWAIMEMLSSGGKTGNFILPYFNFNKKDYYSNVSETENFLLKPENGSILPKIIYVKQSASGLDLFSKYGSQHCHRFDVKSIISPIIQNKKWILLKAPDLITNNGWLFVKRIYMQKGAKGNWEILFKTSCPQGKNICRSWESKLDNASMQIINYINCFIPDMGICFADFVLDIKGTPYFLNLGGWENKLLSKKWSENIRTTLCKNILEYAEAVDNRRKGEADYVD